MMRRVLLTACSLFLGAACASGPELIQAREAPADPVELFRRARFAELVELQGRDQMTWTLRSRANRPLQGWELSDWQARNAYRQGDGATAARAVEQLHKSSYTRKVVGALLDNVDTEAPLRQSFPSGEEVELDLHPEALLAGFPVVRVEMHGRKFHMLWDTGASENVLSPSAVDALDLVRTDVQFPVIRAQDGYVVRFSATGVESVHLDRWRVTNMPWLVTPLDEMAAAFKTIGLELSGFLSPQLLLREGCFAIDRANARLRIGFTRARCGEMMVSVRSATPMFRWNGEIYAAARVHQSPDLAVQVETGSPVTFLRADATRYLPKGLIGRSLSEDEAEIAHDLRSQVRLSVADVAKPVATIDLEASRNNVAHDDIATVGTDVLLHAHGLVMDFVTMQMGFLSPTARGVATVD